MNRVQIKFTRILIACLVSLCIHSCTNDEMDDTFTTFDKSSLNEKGETFINTIQHDPQWQKNWRTVEKAGTPRPNEAICAFSFEHGTYFALPIENKGEVTHVAFYPINDDKPEIKIGTPVIVGEKQTQRPEFAKSFFAARSHTIWEEEKMTVNQGLKFSKYNRINNSTKEGTPFNSITRSSTSLNFPANIWVYYEYAPNGTYIESIEYQKQEIIAAFQQGVQRAKTLIPGILYQSPYMGYSINIIVSNSSSAEYAEQTAMLFLSIATRPLRELPFIHRAWCVYMWEPIGTLSPEPGGGFPQGEEEREERCPICQNKIKSCPCPDITFQVLFDGDYHHFFFELLKPYHIQVIIGGKKASKAEQIMVQMAKHRMPEAWTSIGYGEIVEGSYNIIRTSFNPGTWSLRAACSLEDGSMYYSDEIVIEERAPSIDKFKDNPVVVNFLKGLWDKSVAFAEANKSTHAVREFGAFIFYNPDGSYSCVEVKPGPVVYLTQAGVHGSMELIKADYADLSDWGNPNRKIPIVVGTMHTHYPLTWAKPGLQVPVGPSSGDKNNKVWPGLVYDYTKNIEAGDPVIDPKNPLKIWTFGPEYLTIR